MRPNRKAMTWISLWRSVAIVAFLLSPAVMAADETKSESEEAFDRLASLRGEWEGKEKASKINVTHTLTANGSRVTEQFCPDFRSVMVGISTVDGEHLVASHYCSA